MFGQIYRVLISHTSISSNPNVRVNLTPVAKKVLPDSVPAEVDKARSCLAEHEVIETTRVQTFLVDLYLPQRIEGVVYVLTVYVSLHRVL